MESTSQQDVSKGVAKPFNDIKEPIEQIMDKVVQKKFQGHLYDPRDSQKWSNEVSEEIIKLTQELSKAFKYSCSVIILQKGESGFHMSASCFWDSKGDGNVYKKYDFDDFYCIVSFFGISRQ